MNKLDEGMRRDFDFIKQFWWN